jgi:uncharacterized coiled-coil protein SlyX
MLNEIRERHSKLWVIPDTNEGVQEALSILYWDRDELITLATKQEAEIQCQNEALAEKSDSIVSLNENVELLTEAVEETQEIATFWAAQAGDFAGKLHNLEKDSHHTIVRLDTECEDLVVALEHKDKELSQSIAYYRKQIVHAQEDIVILEAKLKEAKAIRTGRTTWPGPY